MLIKRSELDRISAGEIDLVFRRWRRATVRAGGSLRTAVGMLAIVDVETTTMAAITADDARRAGYPSRAALLADLRRRDSGTVHRITVRPAGEDPRVALRDQTDLSQADLDELRTRLSRLDRRSSWTEQYLRLIDANPHVRAQDLADQMRVDKAAFKANVAKLKALGLTISHSPGYELSARGRAWLDGQS